MTLNSFENLQNIPEKELVPGIYARLLHTEGMTVAHVRLEGGAILPEHQHPHEQVTNILEGELEMTVNGQTRLCKAGDIVKLYSNVPHSAIARTACRVIDVFHPVREDYRDL